MNNIYSEILSKEVLIDLYCNKKLSLKVIAEKFNCQRSTVARHMTIHGIIRRAGYEAVMGKRKGVILSEEIKDKIRQKHLGKKLSSSHRDKVIKTLNHSEGDKNPNWKGGVNYKNGYRFLRMPDHPNSLSNGYIAEHRLIAEQHVGRPLTKDEHVHHINGVKDDNRLENLMVVSGDVHLRIHWSEDGAKEKQSKKMKQARKDKFWSTKKK